MSLLARERAEGKDHAPKEKNYEKEKVEKMEVEDPSGMEEKERKRNVVVQGLERSDASVIVRWVLTLVVASELHNTISLLLILSCYSYVYIFV
jgi:hypothetical protein